MEMLKRAADMSGRASLYMAFILMLGTLTACDNSAKKWETPAMTALSPRLQIVFKETKTVCFGRFIVDIPRSAVTIWGKTDIPLGVSVLPERASEVQMLAQNFIDELKNEKAIYHDDVPLLISVDEVTQPLGRIITGYEGFEAVNDLRINGYFKLDNSGLIVESRPLQNRREKVVAEILDIAKRIRLASESEISGEPGNCIENGFLPDGASTGKEARAELIRIGFRLKEYPDTHFSIFTGPSNPHYSEGNSLKWQLEKLEKNLAAEDPNHPNLKTKYFRRGTRQINEWHDGFEALSRTPELPEVHSFHEFAMDFKGTPYDPLKPYADIRMQTGVSGNAAGATKASLTDEEAIAVWDKITSTIRVRPTSAVPVKSAVTDTVRYRPLGELAATGRECPQTGWWESDEPASIKTERQRHIQAGDRMPHILSAAEPSLWQKLKGERPSHQIATVWKLVGYDDAPATHANVGLHTSSAGEGSSDEVAAKDALPSVPEAHQQEATLPKKEV